MLALLVYSCTSQRVWLHLGHWAAWRKSTRGAPDIGIFLLLRMVARCLCAPGCIPFPFFGRACGVMGMNSVDTCGWRRWVGHLRVYEMEGLNMDFKVCATTFVLLLLLSWQGWKREGEEK